jgi:hypothetical protein
MSDVISQVKTFRVSMASPWGFSHYHITPA